MTETAHHYPETFTAAKRALRQRTGSHTVWLSSRAHHRREAYAVLDVTGPTADGELLTVVVGSGFLPLRVLGGNVHVELGSASGNVVTVTEAARPSTWVHVWSGCKVTAYGVDPERFTGDQDRVRAYPLSADHRLDPPAPVAVDCPF